MKVIYIITPLLFSTITAKATEETPTLPAEGELNYAVTHPNEFITNNPKHPTTVTKEVVVKAFDNPKYDEKKSYIVRWGRIGGNMKQKKLKGAEVENFIKDLELQDVDRSMIQVILK